jgi:glycosyltransferase involved in cell wall biosynthesis
MTFPQRQRSTIEHVPHTDESLKSRLISVVMIFYDAERFLDEAIASVRAQSYPTWELLLIDDGSTDGGIAIAASHAAADPERIRLLHHPGRENRGMSASRNRGIAHARGEYLAFLDADDRFSPDQLAQQVALLEVHPEAGAVYGCLRYWYSWPGNPWHGKRDIVTSPPLPEGTVAYPPAMLRKQFERADIRLLHISSIMVRRDLALRVGGFEDEFRNLYEDQVFHVKIFLAAPVLVSGQVWGWYRQHPDSTCSQALMTLRWRLGEDARFAQWLARYIAGHPIHDPATAAVVRRWQRRHASALSSPVRDPVRVFGPLLPARIRKRLRPIWQRLTLEEPQRGV